MKPKTIALLVVAITCGLGASYMTSRLLAERSNAPEEAKVTILVAKTKVPAFKPITDPALYFEPREMTESPLTVKAIKSFDEIKGKSLQRPLKEGLQVTPEDLVSAEANGITVDLPPGMRAVSLKVNPETIVGGFVQPKSHVDVLVVMRRDDANSVAKIILQNMLVLAVDVNDKKEDGKNVYLGTTVTLAVKPEEAAQLALAQSMGEIRLTLRGLGDDKTLVVKDTTPKDFGKPGRMEGGPTIDEGDSGTQPGPKVNVPTPQIPAIEDKPAETPKPEEKTVVEEKPVETHEMTITIGFDTFKARFVKDEKEGWQSPVSRGDDAPPAKATPPAGGSPPAAGTPPAGGKAAEGKPGPTG